MMKNKNSKMTAIYRIRSASYDFLGQYPLKVGAAFSKLPIYAKRKTRTKVVNTRAFFMIFFALNPLVFAGLKTFKVEPFKP